MLLGIDHLVIAVHDPDAAVLVLERDLGLTFTGGGRHELAGTFNRLAFLGDSYVELIGVFDRSLVLANSSFAVGQAALALLDDGREGLATWAVATDDATGDARALQTAGSPIAEPVSGSRTRPDGEVVRWLTAFPLLGPAEPPFLIEHEQAGAEWGESARAERAVFRHAGGGVLRLAGLGIPVADVARVAARFAGVVGIAFDSAGRAAVGSQQIALLPHDSDSGAFPCVTIAAADPDAVPLDIVRLGVRWRRVYTAPRA